MDMAGKPSVVEPITKVPTTMIAKMVSQCLTQGLKSKKISGTSHIATTRKASYVA
jgi:hypothetical protein